jgi:beta-lactamase regulating signal transducer with metallopeptidase domain
MLVAYLLNSFWQISVIAALAMSCSIFLRRMPGRYKHILWVVCLAACVLVPLATVLTQDRASGNLPAGTSQIVDEEHAPAASRLTRGQSWAFLRLRSRTSALRFTPMFVSVLAWTYGALLIFRCVQLSLTYRRTVRMRKRAYARSMPPVLSRITEQCRRLFSIPAIPVLCSEEISSPSTLGWRQPVLLVPGSFFEEELSVEDLMSALSHELVHIRRHDFLLNLVYEAMSLPLSFHPAAGLIKARIAQTRELACDEMAARVLPSEKHYAQSLLHIAQNMFAGAPSASSNYAMGLFDTQALEERIMNILNMRKNGRRGSRPRMVAALFLVGAVSIVLSAFSVRVSSDNAPADAQRFVGTWVTKYKGQTFITIKLKSENGSLGGSCIHVDRLDMLVDGELVPSSDQYVEQEIVQAKVSGNKLDLQIGGHDSIHFELTLKGASDAEVLAVGDSSDAGKSPDQGPPQKKPWHFQRVAESQ